MKRPIAWVGFAIMIVAVLVGFVPTLWSLLLLFATSLLGGYWIKQNAAESYLGFVKLFRWFAAIGNFVAAGMLLLTPLDYLDKASHAFLPLIVGLVIITLLRNQNNSAKSEDS